MAYIRFPIETNPQVLMQDVYDYIQAHAPQWNPNDGNLDTWIIQALAATAAETRDLASDVPDDIFRYFGANLMALPPRTASPSMATSTWTMIDDEGHTIPDGTHVGIVNDAGLTVAFKTIGDVIIPAGDTVSDVGAVTLQSVEPGLDTAGLGGPGIPIVLLDVLDFVQSAVLVEATSGGQDDEGDADYLDRLERRLRLLSTRPILPADFATLARDVEGVFRAVAVDMYDPDTETYDNERMIAIAALDEAGDDVPPLVMAEVVALLDANREVNFVVKPMASKRTLINVIYEAKALPGYTPSEVEARVDQALADFLDPASWGTVGGDPTSWVDQIYVRYSDIGAVISNTDGIDYWSLLQISVDDGPIDIVDLLLDAPATIAEANTVDGIDGTVT